LHIESKLGSKLDTLMDTINMSLMNIIFIYLTWNNTTYIRQNHILILLITLLVLSLRHILAFIFLHKPSTIHLWSGKISGGILLFMIIITLGFKIYIGLYYFVCLSYILYGMEAMLIYLLKRKDTNEKITSIFEIEKRC
jgi:hypothetical protein